MASAVPPEETFLVRPPAWLRGLTVAAAVLFFVVAALLFRAEVSLLWRGAAVVLVVAAIGGVLDSWLSVVELRADEIVIRTLGRRERVPIGEAESVKTEGGYTVLRMKDGRWVKLPDWVGGGRGVRNRIAARIARA